MSLMSLEDKIYNAQYRLIKSRHSDYVANRANYGWGVAGDDLRISVATKVYGVGILQSEADYADRKITHEWRSL